MPETNDYIESIRIHEAIIIGKMESMSIKSSAGLVFGNGTYLPHSAEERLPKVSYKDVADLCAKFREMQAIIVEAHNEMRHKIAEKLAPFFK